jgi:MFS family permease
MVWVVQKKKHSEASLKVLKDLQYDAGVLGGVLLHKPFLDAIGNPSGVYIIPMISSSYSLAACVTSLFVATFAFQIGRRWTIILGCIVAVIGSIIQTSAYSVAQLIVGRVCTVSFVSFATYFGLSGKIDLHQGFAIGCISR